MERLWKERNKGSVGKKRVGVNVFNERENSVGLCFVREEKDDFEWVMSIGR